MSEDIIERLRDYSSPIMGMDRIAGEAANEIESLRQQLADSQKREVMLRTALNDIPLAVALTKSDEVVINARKALAATADFDEFQSDVQAAMGGLSQTPL